MDAGVLFSNADDVNSGKIPKTIKTQNIFWKEKKEKEEKEKGGTEMAEKNKECFKSRKNIYK